MDNVVKLHTDEVRNFTTLENYPNLKWIEAAISILRDKGPKWMNVAELCEIADSPEAEFNALYSNFEKFLHDILDYWYEKETLLYIDKLDEISGSGEEVLCAMLEIIHHGDRTDEIAIRNWALKCPIAHGALARVDRTRLDVIIGLFREVGFSESDSSLRAKIMYTANIGHEYTSVSSSLDKKLDMLRLLMHRD